MSRLFVHFLYTKVDVQWDGAWGSTRPEKASRTAAHHLPVAMFNHSRYTPTKVE
jgi:hypothetical protein